MWLRYSEQQFLRVSATERPSCFARWLMLFLPRVEGEMTRGATLIIQQACLVERDERGQGKVLGICFFLF